MIHSVITSFLIHHSHLFSHPRYVIYAAERASLNKVVNNPRKLRCERKTTGVMKGSKYALNIQMHSSDLVCLWKYYVTMTPRPCVSSRLESSWKSPQSVPTFPDAATSVGHTQQVTTLICVTQPG
jgi:hypothetical protein